MIWFIVPWSTRETRLNLAPADRLKIWKISGKENIIKIKTGINKLLRVFFLNEINIKKMNINGIIILAELYAWIDKPQQIIAQIKFFRLSSLNQQTIKKTPPANKNAPKLASSATLDKKRLHGDKAVNNEAISEYSTLLVIFLVIKKEKITSPTPDRIETSLTDKAFNPKKNSLIEVK